MSDTMMSTTDRLVYMANQIARNFAIEGEEVAIEATRRHIRRYWDPLMRQRVIASLAADPAQFSDIARGAVEARRGAAG